MKYLSLERTVLGQTKKTCVRSGEGASGQRTNCKRMLVRGLVSSSFRRMIVHLRFRRVSILIFCIVKYERTYNSSHFCN